MCGNHLNSAADLLTTFGDWQSHSFHDKPELVIVGIWTAFTPSAKVEGLLNQLIRQYSDKRIHLILDNAPWHKGPKVREWFQTNGDRLKLHFLPKYSPKLNATEYVWRKVKRLTTHNRYFETAKELAGELFRRFNRFQGNPASLRSTIAGFT